MPSPPELGEDVATHRARLYRQQPIDLGRDWPCPLSVTAAYSPAGRLGQNGVKWAPRETLSKAFLSENASVPRKGMLCMAHAWMGFQPTQVQTSFSLWERGRWQERKPRGQDVASIQVGRAPLWNEHVGRGIRQRNEFKKCCGERNTEIYFKMKDL